MPRFKINVNGEKYVISGMSRGACNKQLLYALAKVNSHIEPSAKVNESNSVVLKGCSTTTCGPKSACSKQNTKPQNKSSTEESGEVYKTLLILGKEKLKQKEDKTSGKLKTKRSSKKPRNPHKTKQKPTIPQVGEFSLFEMTEKLERSKISEKANLVVGKYKKTSFSWPKSGIYTRTLGDSDKMEQEPLKSGSYKYLTDLVNAQKKCLKTQRLRIKEKDKKIKHYSKRLGSRKTDQTLTEHLIVNSDGNQSEGIKGKIERITGDEKVVDTDHDTGISEQHSSDIDGTYDIHSSLANKSPMVSVISFVDKEKIVESVEEVQSENIPASAGSQNCCNADVKGNEFVDCKQSEDSPRTLNSILTVESDRNNAIDPKHDAEKELDKIHKDIKVLQSQLEKQNRVINLLTDLLDQDEPVEQGNVRETYDADVDGQIKSLRSSIALSVELYDYQKSEMEINAAALQHTETEIRRKRWHVDSLRKHLNSLTLCTHSRKDKRYRLREKYCRVSGTLV